jgi:hypothetical protein
MCDHTHSGRAYKTPRQPEANAAQHISHTPSVIRRSRERRNHVAFVSSVRPPILDLVSVLDLHPV